MLGLVGDSDRLSADVSMGMRCGKGMRGTRNSIDSSITHLLHLITFLNARPFDLSFCKIVSEL